MKDDLYHESEEINNDLFEDSTDLDIDLDALEEEAEKQKEEKAAEEQKKEEEANKETANKEASKTTRKKTTKKSTSKSKSKTAAKPSRGEGHRKTERKGKARDKKVVKKTEKKEVVGAGNISPKQRIKSQPKKSSEQSDPFGIEPLKRGEKAFEIYFRGKKIYDSAGSISLQWGTGTVKINSIEYKLRQISIVKK